MNKSVGAAQPAAHKVRKRRKLTEWIIEGILVKYADAEVVSIKSVTTRSQPICCSLGRLGGSGEFCYVSYLGSVWAKSSNKSLAATTVFLPASSCSS